MAFRDSIRKRSTFVNRLTVSEVAVFTGVDPRTVKRKCPDIGSKSSSGWHVYTVADACCIFEFFNGRKPTGVEVANLLLAMGIDSEEGLRAEVLRLYARGYVENADIRDRDR